MADLLVRDRLPRIRDGGTGSTRAMLGRLSVMDKDSDPAIDGLQRPLRKTFRYFRFLRVHGMNAITASHGIHDIHGMHGSEGVYAGYGMGGIDAMDGSNSPSGMNGVPVCRVSCAYLLFPVRMAELQEQETTLF